MGLIKLTTSLVLITLFSIAVIGFATNFANDNDSPINVADDENLSRIYDEDISETTEFFEDVNSSAAAFTLTTLEPGDETSSSGGQFKVGLGTMINMAENSLNAGYTKLIGEDTGLGIFLTALIGVLGFMVIAYGWKAWVGRNPD